MFYINNEHNFSEIIERRQKDDKTGCMNNWFFVFTDNGTSPNMNGPQYLFNDFKFGNLHNIGAFKFQNLNT